MASKRWSHCLTKGGSVETLTEDEILESYYPYWSARLREVGKEHLISNRRCIEDWCIGNWAWEAKDENNG